MDDILKIQSISRGNTSRTKILEKGETVVKCLTGKKVIDNRKANCKECLTDFFTNHYPRLNEELLSSILSGDLKIDLNLMINN